MNIHQKAHLFRRLIDVVKAFDSEQELKMSSGEVEEVCAEFGDFTKKFVKRLRKRKQ